MAIVVTNTSPLVYLHRVGGMKWLPELFDEIWTPNAVVAELEEGTRRGYDVPDPSGYSWMKIVDPKHTPSHWLSLDLGAGELAAMALSLENPEHIIILDDSQARRTAQAAGLTVWGTLKVILQAKDGGIIDKIAPVVDQLTDSGLWVSGEVRQRILALADEGS